MIAPLQSLRFVLALIIFLFHFPGCEVISPQVCDMAVSCFMLLSGYVMTLAARRHPLPSYGSYLFKRFWRIWPLNVVSLAVAVTLWVYPMSVDMASLLMVQAWIPDSSYYYGENGAAWFLSDLMFFYLLFPALYRLMWQHRRAAVFSLAGGLLLYFAWVGVFCPAARLEGLIYVAPWVRIFDFVMGMAAACIFEALPTPSPRRAALIQAVAVAAMAIFIAVSPAVSPRITLASWWWLPGAALIIALSLRGTWLDRLLSLRGMVWLGNVSFGIYMTHLLVIYISEIVLQKFSIAMPLPALVVADLVVTVGVSAVLRRLKLC